VGLVPTIRPLYVNGNLGFGRQRRCAPLCLFPELPPWPNGSSYIRGSPGQRYCRDSDGTRCLRSNQCNGLDRFPGSAASARKRIIAGGMRSSRAPIPVPAEPEWELPLPPLLALTDLSNVDGRTGARHKTGWEQCIASPSSPACTVTCSHWPAYLGFGCGPMLAPLKLDQRPRPRDRKTPLPRRVPRVQCLAVQLPTQTAGDPAHNGAPRRSEPSTGFYRRT